MRVGGIHQFKVSDGRNRLPPTHSIVLRETGRPCRNARAIQRISDPEATVFIVSARPLYILSMDITACATTLQ